MTTTTTTSQTPAAPLPGAEKTSLDQIQEGDWVCFRPAFSSYRAAQFRAQVTKVKATQITANGARFLKDGGKEITASSRKAQIYPLGAPLSYNNPMTYDQLLDQEAVERAAEEKRLQLLRDIYTAMPQRWDWERDIVKLEAVLAALLALQDKGQPPAAEIGF